jgi:hypothetical protein
VPVTTGLQSTEEIIRLDRNERQDRDVAISNNAQTVAD